MAADGSGYNARQMRHRAFLWLVGTLTAATLLLTASRQIYDSNLYLLSEATALLAGDHPYRDFFEGGVPLAAYLSAGALWLAGHRLIGEFALQWLLIVGGTVIAFHVGLRLSRSLAAGAAVLPVVLVILGITPTYHAPKLFLYPLAVWLFWRYLERPGVRRAWPIGVATAVAFGLRHDHGLHLAAGATLTFGLARLMPGRTRDVRAAVVESLTAGGTALALVMPWLVVVQTHEGIAEYLRMRSAQYAVSATRWNPFSALLDLRPIATLIPDPAPPAEPGVITFAWEDDVTAAEQQALVGDLRLAPEPSPPAGRAAYRVPDRHDTALLALEPYVDAADGVDFERLEQQQSILPPRGRAQMWLLQTTLLVPLLMLLAAARGMRTRAPTTTGSPLAAGVDTADATALASAALLLVVVDVMLFREASYFVAVAPLTAALATRLMAGPPGGERRAAAVWRQLAAVLFLAAAGWATAAAARDLSRPGDLVRAVPQTWHALTASPPIDGYLPRAAVDGYDRAQWDAGAIEPGRLLIRYVHDCTADGDRLLVTGQTPFHVSYYAGRPMAGGQLHWHYGVRSDPAHEAQLLALLERQSVPFAISTHDPVLHDFARYPRIHRYLMAHYDELPGSGGLLLVDRRRAPAGSYGHLGFPCFR